MAHLEKEEMMGNEVQLVSRVIEASQVPQELLGLLEKWACRDRQGDEAQKVFLDQRAWKEDMEHQAPPVMLVLRGLKDTPEILEIRDQEDPREMKDYRETLAHLVHPAKMVTQGRIYSDRRRLLGRKDHHPITGGFTPVTRNIQRKRNLRPKKHLIFGIEVWTSSLLTIKDKMGQSNTLRAHVGNCTWTTQNFPVAGTGLIPTKDVSMTLFAYTVIFTSKPTVSILRITRL